MSELKSDDFLLVNREGVDYKITLESLAEYLQVEIPEPDPIYSTKLTTKSKCEANCTAGEYVRGTLAGWTTEVTTASTEPPKFYFRLWKNCVGGKNIGMDDFVPCSAWIEYDGTVQNMGEVTTIEDDWVAFYIEDKAVCGDEVQQLRSGNYEYVCWPAILTEGEITETEIGKFSADNVKLSQWDNNHPTETGAWTRWSFSVNGGRPLVDEQAIANGQPPTSMIDFLNGMEVDRTVVKAGDVVTATTVYEYGGHQGCTDKPPFTDSSCTVTVTGDNRDPWEGQAGIYHLIVSDPNDPRVAKHSHIYKLDTKEEVNVINAPGEWIVTGANTVFKNSRRVKFGDLTDTSEVTNMVGMFMQMTGPIENVANWNTSKVEDMSTMFMGCQNFNEDISNWDTSEVWEMKYMFFTCTSFNQDLSEWCVNKVSERPESFDDNAGNWSKQRPVWGTCPRGED